MPKEKEKGFYDYFNENMEELGLPAPRSLFGTVSTAVATIAALSKVVEKGGATKTVAEAMKKIQEAKVLAGAGVAGVAAVASEITLQAGAMLASYYVGACIGSLAVATGKSVSGGLSIGDCLATASSFGIGAPLWLRDILAANPALLNRTNTAIPAGVRNVLRMQGSN